MKVDLVAGTVTIEGGVVLIIVDYVDQDGETDPARATGGTARMPDGQWLAFSIRKDDTRMRLA